MIFFKTIEEPRGKPRGIFDRKEFYLTLVRSLIPQQAAEIALAIAVQLKSSTRAWIKRYTAVPCRSPVKWARAVLLAFFMLASGCIGVADKNWIVSQQSQFGIQRQVVDCAAIDLQNAPLGPQGPSHDLFARAIPEFGLNAGGFSFTTWNIRKGKAEKWNDDFVKICRNTDILILQEAYLSDNLKKMLRQEDLQWDLAMAFTYQKIEAGVLTAAKATPNLVCSLSDKEPITRIPKSTLVTRYPISGKHQELLVANIHAINFTLGYGAFKKQCDRLESMLAGHQGPMIMAGDFNTWSKGRMSHVNAMAIRLELSPVFFNEDLKSKFFGHYVDHVFYRGLEKINATTLTVATSDHNPLTVVFKLADETIDGI
jgi:endonuclease/exonuclease/phosphatase (EEP) superfamily protein YafD